MKYLVISDVHANLEALEAALAHVECDAMLVLGDLVGYGADPNAVVERVRGLAPLALVRGNHDKVGSGIDGVESFNHLARRAISWTASVLTPSNREWLAALPKGPHVVDDFVEICHGAPGDEDEYIFDYLDARRAIEMSRRPLCLFGHTHVPAVFRLQGEMTPVTPERGASTTIQLDSGARYLVNCGAVGQPRDGDPRAAFGVVDTGARTITLLRVPYDVAAAQAKILAAGLPEVLAQRLAIGR
jgi:diadenosine tetraphosphatase ApaH/serine/threonine PP2A family protein phosphatase